MNDIARLVPGAALIAALACSGCGLFSPLISDNPYGVREVLPTELVKRIDLIKLLDPQNKAWTTPTMSEEEQLGRAVDAFYTKYGTDRDDLIRRRNGLQERILIASTQLATEYEKYLKRADSAANLTLGSITTALAGLGAIFTNVDTVRILAGSAAITSGVRAEWNETMFQSVTIQVLIKGIRSRRAKLYDEIVKRRTNKPVHEYTVEEAIKDAIEYHGAFNLVVGLEESAIALDRAHDPGLADLNRLMQDPVVRRGLGLTAEPSAAALDANLAVDQLTAAVAPFAGELSVAKDEVKAANTGLDTAIALFDEPRVLTDIVALTTAKTAVTTAMAGLDTKVAEARTKVATEAAKDPSVDALKQALASLALDTQRLTGNALTEGHEKMRVELAKSAVKIEQLRRIATEQGPPVKEAIQAHKDKVISAFNASGDALKSLGDLYLVPLYAACDAQIKKVNALPSAADERAAVLRAAREQLDQGERAATRIEAATAAIADKRPDVKTLTQQLRDTLRELRRAIDNATK